MTIQTEDFYIEDGVLVRYEGMNSVVRIPDGVTEIKDYSFYDCLFITEVCMPDSVIIVGEKAFHGCKALKKIHFSVSLEIIKSYAFAGCTGLKEVLLPDTMKEIEYNAFQACSGLKSFQCHSSHLIMKGSIFSSVVDLSPKLYDSDGFFIVAGCLIHYKGSEPILKIPSTVRCICGDAMEAFEGTVHINRSLKKVIIPDYVDLIQRNAFHNCVNLQEVQVAERTEIDPYAFSGSMHLMDENGFLILNKTVYGFQGTGKTLKIPEGVRRLSADLFSCSEFFAWSGNKELEQVILPESLEKIGACAFYNCRNLKEINLPQGLQEIGKSAFSGCHSLLPAAIPCSEHRIGDEAFYGCGEFADEQGFIRVGTSLLGYFGSDDAVTVPEGITRIHSGAFSDSHVRMVVLPSTLLYLSDAFSGCKFLERVVIPEGITTLEPRTFSECIRLTEIALPDSLTEIKEEAFRECSNLQTIVLPPKLKTIGERAFIFCSSLTQITLPEGVQVLGPYAFSKCTALEEAVLPHSLKEIRSSAFSECSRLKRAVLFSEDCKIDSSAFYACPELSGPNGMVILGTYFLRYTGAGGTVVIPEGVTEIGPDAFHEGGERNGRFWYRYRESGSLTHIIFPSSLKRICKKAFKGCSGLETIQLPDSLEQLDEEAFAECSKLREITIPDRTRVVCRRCFASCEALNSISIGCCLRTLPTEVFEGCSSLRDLTIPSQITDIGEDAFSRCENLAALSVHPDNPVFSTEDGILLKNKTEIFYVPRGLHLKSYEISPQIQAVHRKAFSDCLKLHKIVIPESVQDIGEGAFNTAGRGQSVTMKEIIAAPGAGKGDIGADLFSFSPQGDSLCYPCLPVHLVTEQKDQIRLALHYCCHPEKYSQEYSTLYAAYAISHEKLIRKRTPKRLADYIDKYFKNTVPEKKEKPVNYKKLSALAKVKMLEEAVLSDDLPRVEEVINGCKNFEFTARALGCACRYCSPQMVELLVRQGMIFRFEYTSDLKRKYDVALATVYRNYTAEYGLMLLNDSSACAPEYHLGLLPKIDRKISPETQRLQILQELFPHAAEYGIDLSDLLYYAILWNNQKIADYLMTNGIKLSAIQISGLTQSQNSWNRSEFIDTLFLCSTGRLTYIFNTLSDLLAESSQKIAVSNGFFQRDWEYSDVTLNKNLFSEKMFPLLLERTDMSKVKKAEILRMTVDDENMDLLSIMVETGGWITRPASRDSLIAYAESTGKTNALAWLLDYKHKTADLAAEQAKADKKLMRELTEDPNSASALKKIWSCKKQEDGTLIITSYKGSDTEVIVPARIGKSSVTAIGEDAFACHTYGRKIANLSVRQQITSVMLPEGIISIGESAFYCCKNLEQIRLPSTLTEIHSRAFSYCEKLKEIKLPDTIKTYHENLFSGCTGLADDNGFIVLDGVLCDCLKTDETMTIPAGVRKIQDSAFYHSCGGRNIIRHLVLPEGLEEIGEKAFFHQSLESVTWPSTLRAIGEYAFAGNPLEEVILPEGLKVIENRAFYTETTWIGSSTLHTVFLPQSLIQLGMETFNGQYDVRSFHISGNTQEIGKNIFSSYSGMEVHTEKGSPADQYMQDHPEAKILYDYKESGSDPSAK